MHILYAHTVHMHACSVCLYTHINQSEGWPEGLGVPQRDWGSPRGTGGPPLILIRVKDGQRDWVSPRGTGCPPLILIRVKAGQRDWGSPTNINQSEGWPEGLGVPH